MLFKNLKIKQRLWLLVIIVMCCLFALVVKNAYDLRDTIEKEKQTKTMHLVEEAYGVVKYCYDLYGKGKISEAQAKSLAIDMVKSLRYGEDDYFWINDMSPAMVMHPFKPELDGHDLSDMKDPDGVRLFIEFVSTVKKSGSGFVFYMWPKPGVSEPVAKVSFVKGFQPWGWIIGSGIYIDDVDVQFTNSLKQALIWVGIIVFLLVVFACSIANSINIPIGMMVEEIKRISAGNLTKRIDYNGRDELGILSDNINKMSNTFNDIIKNILSSTIQVVDILHSLKEKSEHTSAGANNQSEHASNIAATAEEMSATITDIAKNAATAAVTSEHAMEKASIGKEVADDTIEVVDKVYASTQELAKTVDSLNQRVSEIGEIITVIKEIADQTNLLALNAAIEAARAGEQGRGFAVVADEVRKLAEKTIKATDEISSKIVSVRRESDKTSVSMKDAATTVTKANSYIKEVGDTLSSIVIAVQTVRDQITQIATAVEQQSAASEEVARNIEKTATIARDIVSLSNDVMYEVNEAANVANTLREDVSEFQVLE
ncbi:MAG: methyl-accepting chemotaxis protein [Candidatus Magnetoovum sp. WYHC-5]|nr:methyl-accepting chemotaxis protein [Candidatus Magnetoovum sp. WYHC-5]